MEWEKFCVLFFDYLFFFGVIYFSHTLSRNSFVVANNIWHHCAPQKQNQHTKHCTTTLPNTISIHVDNSIILQPRIHNTEHVYPENRFFRHERPRAKVDDERFCCRFECVRACACLCVGATIHSNWMFGPCMYRVCAVAFMHIAWSLCRSRSLCIALIFRSFACAIFSPSVNSQWAFYISLALYLCVCAHINTHTHARAFAHVWEFYSAIFVMCMWL